MAVSTNDTRDDAVDTVTTAEPAHSADVTEGGVLGAVGGGIVGAIAGGPIGAIIGAVIGGGFSAIAVDAVDHYDNDSDRVPDTEPDYTPGQTMFTGAGLADAPVGSVFDGSLEPASREYVVEEVPVLETIEVFDIEDSTRILAYQLWEERGHRDGFALEDWLDAEQVILAQIALDSTDDDENAVIVEEVILY